MLAFTTKSKTTIAKASSVLCLRVELIFIIIKEHLIVLKELKSNKRTPKVSRQKNSTNARYDFSTIFFCHSHNLFVLTEKFRPCDRK